MIETPEKLSQDILDQIAKEYVASVETVNVDDMDYVIHRFETTMMKLRAADDWRSQIDE